MFACIAVHFSKSLFDEVHYITLGLEGEGGDMRDHILVGFTLDRKTEQQHHSLGERREGGSGDGEG